MFGVANQQKSASCLRRLLRRTRKKGESERRSADGDCDRRPLHFGRSTKAANDKFFERQKFSATALNKVAHKTSTKTTIEKKKPQLFQTLVNQAARERKDAKRRSSAAPIARQRDKKIVAVACKRAACARDLCALRYAFCVCTKKMVNKAKKFCSKILLKITKLQRSNCIVHNLYTK